MTHPKRKPEMQSWRRNILAALAAWVAVLLAFASPAFAVIQSTYMRDANLTVPPAAYAVATINTFSAARTLTLPSAASTFVGQSGAASYYQNTLVFYDAANAITGSNTLTITAASGETINGSSTLVVSTTGATVILAPISGSAWQATVLGVGTSVVPAVTCAANQWVSAIAATGLGTCSATGTVVATGKTATFSNTLTFTGTDSSSIAFGAGGTIGATGYATTGQLPGTATNDDAAAGKIGEYVTSTIASGSAISLVTTTPANLTSVSLTAGDWDLACFVQYTGTATTVTSHRVSINTTTATIDSTPGFQVINPYGTNIFAADNPISLITPVRKSLASTTTVYCVVQAFFSGGTDTMYGFLRARRVR